jgi:hypothetical protein
MINRYCKPQKNALVVRNVLVKIPNELCALGNLHWPANNADGATPAIIHLTPAL